MFTDQALSHLSSKPSPVIMELTFGDGQVSRQLLAKCQQARVIGVDCDPTVKFQETKDEFGDRFDGFVSKWSQVPSVMENSWESSFLDAIFIEMGPSKEQLEDQKRGFDLDSDGHLDLRYNFDEGVEAAELLKHIDVDKLQKVLKIYGGTVKAKSVASEIVEQRYLLKPIQTTVHLREVLWSLHENDRFWLDRGEEDIEENISSVFRALRAFTNNEINELYFAVRMAEQVLSHNGLLVIKTTSLHEKNLLQKYLYRDSGPSGSFWKIVAEESLQMTFSKV